jgi:hypothetical protein
VYVSDTQMLKPSVATYAPVPVTSAYPPTYPLPPSSHQSGTIKLDRYRINSVGEAYTFRTNETYWIMLGSYHQYLGVKEEAVSNQISVTF